MKRRALFIMNPGREGVNLVPSVPAVCERYKNYLMSPVGGYWQKDEILELDRLGVDGGSLNSDFVFKLRELNKPDIDYSIIVFIGHGGACKGIDCIQLEDGDIIPVKDLTVAYGNSSPIKRTVVIDACRSFVDIQPQHLILEQRLFSGNGMIDGMACRDYYNRLIKNAKPHVEIIQSTQYGQIANGTNKGTAFSDALFDTINKNQSLWNQLALNNPVGEYCRSFFDVEDEVRRKMAAYNQVPQLTCNLQETTHFPLYALKRATTKQLEGGQVIGVIED